MSPLFPPFRSALPGTVLSLLALLSKEAMAEHKVHNIDHYRQLFGEYQLLFVGDSGQADVLVAEHLVTRHPEAIRLVLIHDVIGQAPPSGNNSPSGASTSTTPTSVQQ